MCFLVSSSISFSLSIFHSIQSRYKKKSLILSLKSRLYAIKLYYSFKCFATCFAFHFHFIGIDLKSEDDQSTTPGNEKANELILRPVISLATRTPSTSNEDDIDGGRRSEDSDDEEHNDHVRINTPMNKPLRAIQSLPYFSFRPASETDIFTIAGSSMISMTPEIPSISYSTLPKNYADTPTIEKYKESVSLYSIQTSNMERARETDFSMPRYFGKSDIITQSVENLSTTKPSPKKTEKSKRLKLLRANLPPLSIHINKEKSKERNIE